MTCEKGIIEHDERKREKELIFYLDNAGYCYIFRMFVSRCYDCCIVVWRYPRKE